MIFAIDMLSKMSTISLSIKYERSTGLLREGEELQKAREQQGLGGGVILDGRSNVNLN
jgi:hypothetical protein